MGTNATKGMPDLQKADPVDSGVRKFVDALTEGYGAYPDLDTMPLHRRRAIAEQLRKSWREAGPDMQRTRDFTAAGVKVRLHTPVDRTDLPVLVYIHGGGWMFFSNDTHDRLMREYAAGAEVAVLGIEYSLSPEAKFPTALEEIDAVLAWLAEDGEALGLDSSRIAIGGDSAGANLAISTCIRRRDRGDTLPSAMVLNYGAFAPEHTDSYERFGGPEFPLDIDEMDMFWENYVSDPALLSNPLVAPLHAKLDNLPPAFLAIAQFDILTDCNVAMAQKLADAGVPVLARTYPGTTHSFLEAMSVAQPARQAIADQAQWLRERLNAGGKRNS